MSNYDRDLYGVSRNRDERTPEERLQEGIERAREAAARDPGSAAYREQHKQRMEEHRRIRDEGIAAHRTWPDEAYRLRGVRRRAFVYVCAERNCEEAETVYLPGGTTIGRDTDEYMRKYKGWRQDRVHDMWYCPTHAKEHDAR